METTGRKRVLLLGLEDGLLWQLTKALAAFDNRFEVQCARDFRVAGEICAKGAFDVIVVDGWEQSWHAGYSMGWDRVSEMRPGRWVILVDCMPMAGLLDDSCSPSAVFLEKPVNPKELPPFLLDLLESANTDAPGEAIHPMPGDAGQAGEAAALKTHFFVPGESYLTPAERQAPRDESREEGIGAPGESLAPEPVRMEMIPAAEPVLTLPLSSAEGCGQGTDQGAAPHRADTATAREPDPLISVPGKGPGGQQVTAVGHDQADTTPGDGAANREPSWSEGADPGASVSVTGPAPGPPPPDAPRTQEEEFHSLMDSGFACLRRKDYPAAYRIWLEAQRLRPEDKRLQANLLRLEAMMAPGPAQ